MMRIRSLNHNPTSGQTVIEYETRENDGRDKVTHKLKSKDLPHPGFIEGLEHLKPRVEEICEVGDVDLVRGFTLHRDEDDDDEWTVGFTATKKIEASNSPLVLNTPAVVPGADVRAGVLEMLGHAKDFIEGTRAQQELVDNKEPAKRDSPGPRLVDNEPPEEAEDVPGDAQAEPVEEVTESAYPEEQPGQIYTGKSRAGNTCTVKNTAGKTTWVGRVSGKPVALDQAAARTAMCMVEEHVKGPVDWKATLELVEVSEDEEGVPAVDL